MKRQSSCGYRNQKAYKGWGGWVSWLLVSVDLFKIAPAELSRKRRWNNSRARILWRRRTCLERNYKWVTHFSSHRVMNHNRADHYMMQLFFVLTGGARE